MITIEMPTWFAIICVVATFLLIVHLIIAEFFVNLIHKKYDLSMKKKSKYNKCEILEKFNEWYVNEEKENEKED